MNTWPLKLLFSLNSETAQKEALVDCWKNTMAVTSYKSWIYAHEPETKQQSTIWAFEALQWKWLPVSSAKLVL